MDRPLNPIATAAPPTVTLRIAEARIEDLGHAVARLAPADLLRLAATPGDIVKITGRTSTVARVELADADHEGLVQIDGTARSNCNAALQEAVSIVCVDHAPAVAVRLSGLWTGAAPVVIPPERMRDDLVGVPVMTGGVVRVPTFAKAVNVQVVRTIPPGVVVIGPRTDVRLVEGEDSPVRAPAVSYEDVGGLERELARVREMVELPLKHSRIFERLGILAPKGVLLYGPPGTGKTLLARAVAAESRVHFIHLNGPEIMRKFYGESEAKLREVFDEAARHAPAVLFIDEIDAVAPKRADVVGDVEKRVVAQLLSLMDGFVSRGQVIVMGATNIPELLDPALRRPGRFDREIEIGVPNTQARLQILRIHTRAMPLAGDVDLAEIAEHSHGFVGADLEALCQEVGMIALRRFLSDTVRLKPDPTTRQPAPTMGPDTVRLKPDPTTTQPDPTTMQPDPTMRPDPAAMSPDPTAMSPDPTTMKPDPTTMKPPPSPVGPGLPAFPLPVGSGFSRTGDDDDTNLDALQVARDDFLTGLKEVEPSATREFFIEKSDTTFASLGGLHEVKQTLAAIVDHSHVHDDIYERAGLAPPRGILLVGPTGTGKTAMARALSGEKQLPLIAIDGPQLYSKWLGESEKALREVFKKARRAAPCILFFDTIDAVAPQAGPDHPGSDVYQRILSQLLREIDNLRDVKGVVLLAATNRPERVDRALLRSGRFDYTVRFAAPNEIDRGAIIRLCCRQVPLEPDVLVDELARSTDGLTGADLESLCKRATLAAIAELRSGRRQAPFAVGRRDFLTALEGMRHG